MNQRPEKHLYRIIHEICGPRPVGLSSVIVGAVSTAGRNLRRREPLGEVYRAFLRVMRLMKHPLSSEEEESVMRAMQGFRDSLEEPKPDPRRN